MKDWSAYLESFRADEVERAFQGCPGKVFKHALELGAGNGAQSKYLASYAQHLISTDFNQDRLTRQAVPGIEYRMCDAEQVGDCFEASSFDLVFASNLFEHLPDSQRALVGIRTVLESEGVVILVMPNALWKAASLVGFYPNAIRLAWRAAWKGRLRILWRRYVSREEAAAQPFKKKRGNNLKSEGGEDSRAGIFWPVPHGAYSTHMEEFRMYRKKRWLREFSLAGFDVVSVRKGPVSSGYGFGLTFLKRLVEHLGCATEYIYILKRSGTTSRYEHFWNAT